MNTEDGNDLRSFWEPHVESWKHSELSQSAYCQNHNLPIHRFGYWKRKLETEQALIPINGFVQVHPIAESPALSILLPNQIRIDGITSENLNLLKQLTGLLQ